MHLIGVLGMKYFFTQKMSWNNMYVVKSFALAVPPLIHLQSNTFPHSTFNWVSSPHMAYFFCSKLHARWASMALKSSVI